MYCPPAVWIVFGLCSVGRSLNLCDFLESICTVKCCYIAIAKRLYNIGYDRSAGVGAIHSLCAIVAPHEARIRCRLNLTYWVLARGRRWNVLPPSAWIVLAYAL